MFIMFIVGILVLAVLFSLCGAFIRGVDGL